MGAERPSRTSSTSNTIQNIGNLARPALLFVTLRATRAEKTRSLPSAWHSVVRNAAVWAMASAATGFGIGYSIGAAEVGAAIGAIGAIAITRRLGSAAQATAERR